MVTDSVGDLLARIQNAQRARHRSARVLHSRLIQTVLEVLKTEGFIDSFEVKKGENSEARGVGDGSARSEIEVRLRYYGPHEPVISSVRRVSKPGKRVYARCASLPRVANGMGMAIVSTSEGVMSDREARRRKIGGEVLAIVS